MKHLAIMVLASFAYLGLAAQSNLRPHIVYMIADDVSWHDLGCYGHPTIRTPHIDQLARKGLKFTNAYLTASSCSPSRCSIISGRYPHCNGAAELHSPLPEEQIPFPLLLKEAGYYTVQSGKSHFGKPALRAFDQAYESEGAGDGGEERWVQCLEERPRDKPFFAWFAAFDAHRAWQADDFGIPHDPAIVRVPRYLVDDPETRKDLASYYNEISRFDFYIGEVVKELDRQQILDNTMIVVMADNGMPFPRAKTRVYDSGMKTPLIISWPNGIKVNDIACHALVSVVDLAPTFIAMAGLPMHEYFQGRSILDLLQNPENTFRKYIFAEHNWHDYEAHERMVRSQDFMFIVNARPNFPNGGPADSKRSPSQYALNHAKERGQLTFAQADNFIAPRPREELFEVSKDPDQFLNLASTSDYQEVLSLHRAILEQWQISTGDSAPESLTPDGFDRETGERLPGDIPNEKLRREMPGVASGGMKAKGQPGF